MASGDIEVHQQRGHRLGSHARAAVGMQRQGAGLDIVPGHALGDQLLGQLCALALGDQPAHDVPAEDVEDHVEVVAAPLDGPLELREIPSANCTEAISGAC